MKRNTGMNQRSCFRIEWVTCLLSLALVAGQGCGPLQWLDTGYSESTPKVYSMDAVKLIRSDSELISDPSAMLQDQYTLGSGRRLLVRYESLGAHVEDVLVTDQFRVELQVNLSGSVSA